MKMAIKRCEASQNRGEPDIAYHERVGLVCRLEAESHKFDSGVIRMQWVGSKCQALFY